MMASTVPFTAHDKEPREAGAFTDVALSDLGRESESRSHEQQSAAEGKSHSDRRFRLSYELLYWLAFFIFAAFAVADRFIGPIYLGSESGGFLPPPCFPGGCLNFPALPDSMPLSVRFFDNYQRATGRLFVAVTPFLIMTQIKVTENWFAEHHPKWLDIGDLRATNNRIHYMMAFFALGIPMIIHMWIIFVPALMGVPFQIFAPGHPEVEGKLSPFIAPDGSLFMQPDDFLRLPLAILCFMILLPLSVANVVRTKNFTLAHWLHIWGAAIYTMDFLRGNHPHAQLFVAPLVIWYIVDRMVGIFRYRTGQATIIHQEVLDDEYVAMFLYIPNQKRKRKVGSVYYYGFPGREGIADFGHPFTSFQNHSKEPLPEAWRERDPFSKKHRFFVNKPSAKMGAKSMCLDDDKYILQADDSFTTSDLTINSNASDDENLTTTTTTSSSSSGDGGVYFFSEWNTAAIVQVHRENRPNSWTVRLQQKAVGDRINFWGPYYSEYAALTKLSELPPLVLIATGAGINYLLDVYTWLVATKQTLRNPVQVYYSTHSLALFQFATDLLCSKPIENWQVSAHLTRRHDDLTYAEDDEQRHATHKLCLGRLSFAQCIGAAPQDAEVYFCGSPTLQWQVELLCADRRLTFHPGHRFSPEPVRDFQIRNGKPKCKCTACPFPFHY